MLAYLLLVACSAPSHIGAIVEQALSTPLDFRLGEYRVAGAETAIHTLASCPAISSYISNVVLMSAAAAGSSLLLRNRSVINSEYYVYLSNEINQCSVGRKFDEMEIFYHAALAVWPHNGLAIKNMAYHLELEHYLPAAASLYEQGLQLLPRDAGLRLQRAFLCPHFLFDRTQGLSCHVRILAGIGEILQLPTAAATGVDPLLEIRYCPGLVYEGYSRCLLKLFPKLAIENLSPLPPRPGAGAGGRGVITVGVVSETFGNSSPGLCLQEIFTLLAASHWPLEIVFLSRHNLITVFAKTMQRLARETYFLDEGNISHSVHLIRDIIKPDILLYLALPTERTTATLSQYRLAPVQIQYGLGHPLSSGAVNSMDYSIISRQMLVSEADLRTAGELFGADGAADPLALCAAKAAACMRTRYSVTGDISFCDDILPRACIGYGHKAIYYTEQIVAFESLGFHIQDFSLLYFSSIGDILRLHEGDGAYCEEAQDLLRELSVSVSAESLGCRGDTQVHLYTCIQHGKKMHPSFDAALLGILNEDPKAVILLSDAMKDLLVRRWAGSWNISPDVIKQRVLFIPRMRHPDYLRLLSYSAVFLNPFPFGSGITSSDAISVCLPLVLLPEHISVLPFALAQVRALGPEYEDLFVVRSVEKYVHRAVQLASESHTDKGRLLRRGICGHKHQLFGAQKLNESVSEWAEFLVNVIKP